MRASAGTDVPDIVHVVETLERGGLERMVVDLAGAQRAAGHRSQIVCLYRPGLLAAELPALGIPLHDCGKRGGVDLRALRRLRHWLRMAPDAVLHTHNANAHYHAVLAATGLPLSRIVNTRHGMGASRTHSRLEWLYRRAMRRTDAVAAVCEAARAAFSAQGVKPRGALLAVPNGIRVERFEAATPEHRAALRAALGLPVGTRLVGTVGRLNPVKDQAALLRAFARVHGGMADNALVLVGDGPLRDTLAAEAGALGIADAVRFLGDRGDVDALLPGFDAFALSSRSEGYSMALLEACAAGLPIVATDVGGNREIVRDGVNGRVVPAGSDVALAEAIASLLRDPGAAAAMGRAGRDWALREASVEAMMRRYDALYEGRHP
ncbi:MAG: glycosyltransferase [Lysobacteraceae bacterium]